ncbi:hypothetical protein [Ruegeria aquimaris]|uniref:Uncharacterized protein n=1 Tax=Ruegeria aquimaris TaxID=2984333 RepID=A0ABT3AEE6_9RHOB|nr:hypothetical protein [Ruegeria sp. XHP0148]MCV2887040.1 hypothetical protein [Ruegeria sp. XHP0148]
MALPIPRIVDGQGVTSDLLMERDDAEPEALGASAKLLKTTPDALWYWELS